MTRLIVWTVMLASLPAVYGQPKAQPEKSVEKAPSLFDLAQVKEGALPSGWTGSDSIIVSDKDGSRSLEAVDSGTHEVQSPIFEISGNFQLDTQVSIPRSGGKYSGQIDITLKGKDNRPDFFLTLMHEPGVWLEFPDQSKWKVTVNRRTEKEIGVPLTRPSHIRLVREDGVYRLIVNGEAVISKRFSNFGDFDRITLNLTGPSDKRQNSIARVFALAVGPVGGAGK